MYKKILLFLVLFLMPVICNAESFDLKSQNVVLYNLEDGTILYEKNKDEKVFIASMTKILTAITAIENIDDLSQKVKLTNNDFNKVGELNLATAGFKVGDTVTYNDLLYGLLFPSGAECALALANNTFSNYEKFINEMNKTAQKIGMENSHFNNPIGYDEENHYSTVNDVYLLFKYAMNNKTFKNIMIQNSYLATNNLLLKNNVLNKYKKLSGKNYMIAGKTGTTKKAGYALASIIKKGEVNLMLVTTTTPLDYKAYYNFSDAFAIYEYYLNNYKYKFVAKKGQTLAKVTTKYTKEDYALITTNRNIKKYINKNTNNIEYKYIGKKDITSKTKTSANLGKVDIYVDGKLVGSTKAILKEKLHFSIIKWIKLNKIKTIVILAILLILVITLRRNVFKKKSKKVELNFNC